MSQFSLLSSTFNRLLVDWIRADINCRLMDVHNKSYFVLFMTHDTTLARSENICGSSNRFPRKLRFSFRLLHFSRNFRIKWGSRNISFMLSICKHRLAEVPLYRIKHSPRNNLRKHREKHRKIIESNKFSAPNRTKRIFTWTHKCVDYCFVFFFLFCISIHLNCWPMSVVECEKRKFDKQLSSLIWIRVETNKKQALSTANVFSSTWRQLTVERLIEWCRSFVPSMNYWIIRSRESFQTREWIFPDDTFAQQIDRSKGGKSNKPPHSALKCATSSIDTFSPTSSKQI